jgi:hypothetical protein
MQAPFVFVIKKAMESIDPAAFTSGAFWAPFMEDICNEVTYYGIGK